MNITIKKVKLDELDTLLQEYLNSITGVLDDLMLIRRLRQCEQYLIFINSLPIGYFAVNEETKLLFQFYLKYNYRRYAEEVLCKIREIHKLESALIFSCDEFFLNSVICMAKKIETQMFFFLAPNTIEPEKKNFTIQRAIPKDTDFILAETGDFFGDCREDILDQIIYLGVFKNRIVAAGGINEFPINNNFANISMIAFKKERKQGFGKAMIQHLILECNKLKYTSSAGCRASNLNSKRTLESAGMYQSTRLLKIII